MATAKIPRTRIGGSGFTVFHWLNAQGTAPGPGAEQAASNSGNLIGYAENVTVTPIQPVAAPEVIQPLNAQRPLEIITPGAATNGTITLTLVELYNAAIWQRLAGLAKSQDIVDIFRTVAAMNKGINVTKMIKPSTAPDGDSKSYYSETFYNIIVASVEDGGETIDVRTMSVQKQMTLWYTHSKKSWINKGDFQFGRNVNTGDVGGTAPFA